MPKMIHEVKLTEAEIERLKNITHKGSGASARTIMHAHILLLSNDGKEGRKTNREISEMFDISPTTVNTVRGTYTKEGLETALNRKTRLTPPHISKITGEFEAQVIAMALSPAPKGTARWTLRTDWRELHVNYVHIRYTCWQSIVKNGNISYQYRIVR